MLFIGRKAHGFFDGFATPFMYKAAESFARPTLFSSPLVGTSQKERERGGG